MKSLLLSLGSASLLLLLATAPGVSAGWVNKQWKQHQAKGAREVISLSQPLNWESTDKGTIDLNGKPVHIKGINWCVGVIEGDWMGWMKGTFL